MYDVKQNIDKKLYPQRYELLLAQISLKEQTPEKEPEPSKLSDKSKALILKVIMAMFAIFFSLGLINAFTSGSIKAKGGQVYYLATNPKGFYFIVFLHIIFLITALYITFKTFKKRNN